MEEEFQTIEENYDVSLAIILDDIEQNKTLYLTRILDDLFSQSNEAENEVRSLLDIDDQVRYNAFIDTLFTKINTHTKETLEPLDIDADDSIEKNNKNKREKKESDKKERSVEVSSESYAIKEDTEIIPSPES